MKIENNATVRFHYTVAEVGHPPSESSRDREPLQVVVGSGQIIPGLEAALLGREAGERFEVTVEPAQAYGDRREDMTQRLPKKYFGGQRLSAGDQVVLQTRSGPRAVSVIKVGVSVVDVDLNHPMAGKTLNFDIEVIEVGPGKASDAEAGLDAADDAGN